MSAIKRIGVVASAVVVLGLPVGAQQPSVAPDLTRAQRTALQAVVTAVDAAATSADSQGFQWPLHVLRASDGSHYVAFSLVAPPGLVAHRPLVLYVRLTTRQEQSVTAAAERSAVAEWLAGQRSTPLRAERGIAFGEMPTYGAAALGNRTQTNVSQGLALLEMERDRARERREEGERERKAALEGEGARAARPLLPFEDFDLNATATPSAGGTAVIMRSLTAGPGQYVLTVGWTDPAAKDPVAATKVFRRTLNLPIASTTEFGLSSVIVADAISIRETPLRADEQSRQPYSIGTTNIVPAQDAVLTMDEHLTLVVQVINPRPAANGKPDVVVGFRLQRTTAAGHEEVGILNPLIVQPGHIAAGLRRRQRPPDLRGRRVYRSGRSSEVCIGCRSAPMIGSLGVSAATETSFTIIGTPAALLRDAPPLAPPFRRESLLTAPVVEAIAASLAPVRPSAGVTHALDAARQRRFIALVPDDNIPPDEQAVRAALRALALYALGDSATAVGVQLRLAQPLAASAGPSQVLLGGLRALEGNDRDALASWTSAIASGIDAAALRPLLMDTYLRQGDHQRATELGAAALAATPDDPMLVSRVAATHLAAGRLPAALAVLERRLQADPEDIDAQWLTLHALFTGFVKGDGPGASAADIGRFKTLARRYIGPTVATPRWREWSSAIP